MAQIPEHGRPVSPYGIRRYGIIPSYESVSVTLSALAIALSLPTVTVVVSSVTQAAGQQTVTLSVPDASVATGGGQTATASPANLTLSVPTAVRFLPAIQRDAGALGVQLSLPSATVSAGPVTQAVTVPGVALMLPDVSFGATGVSVPVPFVRPVSVYGIRRWGPPSPSGVAETTFNQTLDAGPLEVSLAPATTARTTTITLGASTPVLTLSVPTADVPPSGTPGVSANPILLRPRQAIRARFTPRPARVLAHGLIEELAPETQSLSTTTIGVALSLPSVTRVPGISTQTLSASVVTLRPPVAVLSGGGAGVLSSGTVRLTLALPSPTVQVSTAVVPATTPAVALSLPVVVPHQVVALTRPTLALAVPAAAINQAAVRGTGTLAVSVTLPAVTVSVTDMTLPAGSQIVPLGLPTVVRTATMTRQPPEVAVALSVPEASLVLPAATTVVLTPVVLTMQLRAPVVLGATSLPDDLVVTTLESRLPEATLTSRFGPYTLRART